MRRRDFTLTALAGALAASSPAAALAGRDDAMRDHQAAYGRVVIGPVGAKVALSEFVILGGAVRSRLDLRNQVPQFREGRADLSGVPILGQLFRPTLEVEFAGAEPVGPVHLAGTTLILATDRSMTGVRHTVFTHGKVSWRPAGRPRPVAASAARAGAAFGQGYLKGDRLLIVIPPAPIGDPA